MPLVTLTIREGKSGEFKSAVLGAVHSALIASGVPEKDRFQRVLELSSDDFRFDPEYPDLTARRTDDFVLIEILLSVGRSVKVKKKIVTDILAGLSKGLGLNAENVMVCFKETLWGELVVWWRAIYPHLKRLGNAVPLSGQRRNKYVER
jgi:phenylpyruvate tautomerase PptA (4-oxalocrotonate tautomerase family)